MSLGEDDTPEAEAPPPTSGKLSAAEATRILFRDPGVRNYLFAGLSGLVLVFVVLFERGADIGGLLAVMIGLAGLILRWTAAGPMFVVIVAYFLVCPFGFPELGSPSRYEIEDNRFRITDLLLAGSALTFLACLYRVLGLTEQALPHEMRFPRKSDRPYRRPPSAITQTEIPRLVYLGVALVIGGQFAWLIVTNLEVDVSRTIPLKFAEYDRGLRRDTGNLPPGTTRFVLISGTLFFGTMVGRLVFGYWRLRTMKPDEGNMVLLDTGWNEGRREYVRQEVWRKWGKKRAAESEQKRRKAEGSRR